MGADLDQASWMGSRVRLSTTVICPCDVQAVSALLLLCRLSREAASGHVSACSKQFDVHPFCEFFSTAAVVINRLIRIGDGLTIDWFVNWIRDSRCGQGFAFSISFFAADRVPAWSVCVAN